MNSALAFQRFAASCNFETHGYLEIQGQGEGEELVYRDDPIKPASSSLKKITKLAIQSFKANPTVETEVALRIFRATLAFKKDDSFCNSKGLNAAILKIDAALESQSAFVGSEEAAFRVRFLAEIPVRLGAKHAPKTKTVTISWLNGEKTSATVREWEIIEWLSNKVYHSEAVASAPLADRWQTYSDIMTGAYKGDHLLISDDPEHHCTEELIALGAIVRTSSHNERGRQIKGWNKDGSPSYRGYRYQDIKALSNREHHWSLEGDHICEILFYAADMRKRTDGTLICAKTARQVDHLIQAGKLKGEKIDLETVHHFTAFQFEFAPDCEGTQLSDWKYWYHKVYSSYLYRAMKKLGYEDANVGPYGFGRTDMNPRIIKLK